MTAVGDFDGAVIQSGISKRCPHRLLSEVGDVFPFMAPERRHTDAGDVYFAWKWISHVSSELSTIGCQLSTTYDSVSIMSLTMRSVISATSSPKIGEISKARAR